MMRQTRIALSVVLLGLILTGCEQTTVDFTVNSWPLKRLKGHIIETDHYRIYTTLNDPIFDKACVSLAEGQYQRIHDALSVEPNEKMICYVFADRREWEAFTRSKLGPRADAYLQIRDGGYSADRMAVLYYLGRYPTLAVMAHELFHMYLDYAGSERVPAWLNEGLSTFFEAHEWQGTTPVFTESKNVFRRNILGEAILGARLFPLKELLATHAGEVSKLAPIKVATYYSEAWALIQFLRNGEGGKYAERFNLLLKELGTHNLTIRASAYLAASDNADNISFGEAVFRQYITDDLEQFDREFRDYMQTLAGLRELQPN
jgi:hypothetical protein